MNHEQVDELIQQTVSEVAELPFINHVDILCNVASGIRLSPELICERDFFTGGTILATNGLESKIVSGKIIKRGYLPCSYICTEQTDILHIQHSFIMGAIISIDANGKFIKCRSDIFSATTRQNKFTRWHIPFHNAEISPDFSILGRVVERTSLHDHYLLMQARTPSTHLKYQGSPKWRFKFAQNSSSEWESIEAMLGKQILESGYTRLRITPGQELQAIIAGYANGVSINDDYLDISVASCWLYLSTIGSINVLWKHFIPC